MKKIFFFIVISIMTFPAIAAPKDPINVRWTSNGFKYSSPAYNYYTRQARYQVRNYETMPQREVRNAFRKFDNKINQKIRQALR